MEYLLYVKLVALNREMTLILIGTNGLKKGKRAWLYFVDSLAGEHLNACTPGNFVCNNGTGSTTQIL